MSNELNFDSLTLIEVPVKIQGKTYTLREANGDAAVAYRNASLRGMTLEDGKVKKLDGIASVEPLLVSMCLFFIDDDGVEKNVDELTVRSWPGRVVKAIFNKAKEISELDEEEDTVESLDKQIEALEKKKEKLLKDSAGNDLEFSQDG
jgi:hypothetical protein